MKFGQNFRFLQVWTHRKCQKLNLAKNSHFCRSGPVENVKNYIWPKIPIFAGLDLSKMSKMKFGQKFTFCRSKPVKNVKNGSWLKFHIFAGPDLSKMSKIEFGQDFSFLQVWTCQKCQKLNLAKNSHFCRSGPVENVKNYIWPKIPIFAGLDLSKMSKMKFGQKFTLLQVLTCRKCKKCKLAKNSHFAGADLSKMSKI